VRIINKVLGKFELTSSVLLGIALISMGLGLTFRSLVVLGLSQKNLESQVLQIVKNHPQVVIESLQAYQRQQQQAQQKAAEAIRQDLTSNPKSFISDSPMLGAKNKKIILIAFSDFQCPFCGKVQKTLKDFMAANGKEVTFIYKHLPLEHIHSEAMSAALASWAANRQGKFWEFHDALFAHQDKLGEEFYIKTAKCLNLNLQQFNSDRQSNLAKAAILKDVEIAKKLGISSTPYFLINGTDLPGAAPLQDFNQALIQAKQNLAKSAH
jgi:protein-disulfide isomerase